MKQIHFDGKLERKSKKRERERSFEFGFYCSICVTRMKELIKVFGQ
jgi:hypothetical protein